MMESVIIACKTIEDELNYTLRSVGSSLPVIWLEQGLHNSPERLRDALQTELDRNRDRRVLLALGFCGNALQGLRASCQELVFPRVDDCISLLLGSVRRRRDVSAEYAAYFFTEGWLRGERNIWVEHQEMLKRYGEELTAELEKSLFGNYRTLGLLDSGVNPVDGLLERTKMIAEGLHLRQQVIPASVNYLKELLCGPWPSERFVVLEQGREVTGELLTFPAE